MGAHNSVTRGGEPARKADEDLYISLRGEGLICISKRRWRRLANAASLDLASNNLKSLKVHAEIAARTLNVDGNRLKKVSITPTMVPHLQTLLLPNNKLEASQLRHLAALHLKKLDVSSNSLGELDVSSFHTLETLYASNNMIRRVLLPQPSLLADVNLSGNALRELHVDALPLTRLNLKANRIRIFDSHVPTLRSLDLTNNKLKSYGTLAELPVTYLSISGNRLSMLPDGLVRRDLYLDSDIPNEIMPGLFLGQVDCARNAHFLREARVTHVLTVMSERLVLDLSLGIEHKVVILDDMPSAPLYKHIPACLAFIRDALAAGRILVHCWAGRSRSASVVVAYVMATRGLSVYEAIEFVEAKRPCIQPGFIAQLRELEGLSLDDILHTRYSSSSYDSTHEESMENVHDVEN